LSLGREPKAVIVSCDVFRHARAHEKLAGVQYGHVSERQSQLLCLLEVADMGWYLAVRMLSVPAARIHIDIGQLCDGAVKTIPDQIHVDHDGMIWTIEPPHVVDGVAYGLVGFMHW